MSAIIDSPRVMRRPLLSVADCADVVQRLDALQPCWRLRRRDFYTLGAALYLDVGADHVLDRYSEHAVEDNETLMRVFPDLLEMCRSTMEELLGARCDLAAERIAVPGFHIFLTGGSRSAIRDSVHLDLQFRHLPVPTRLTVPTRTFTLPIELPESGGRIEFCRLTDGGRPRGMEVAEYRLGELFVHTGRTPHRRCAAATVRRSRRITLQGHAVEIAGENRWLVYW